MSKYAKRMASYGKAELQKLVASLTPQGYQPEGAQFLELSGWTVSLCQNIVNRRGFPAKEANLRIRLVPPRSTVVIQFLISEWVGPFRVDDICAAFSELVGSRRDRISPRVSGVIRNMVKRHEVKALERGGRGRSGFYRFVGNTASRSASQVLKSPQPNGRGPGGTAIPA